MGEWEEDTVDGEGAADLAIRRRAGVVLQRSAARGFLGGMSIDDQIDHALGFARAVEQQLGRAPRSVVDLGSGGGVPGIILIARWPTTRVVLVDASDRRTSFLRQEMKGWGVADQVEVVRGRAEEIGRLTSFRQQFEVVTARSFGSPAVTSECGSPLVEIGGWLIVSEPPDEPSSLRWPQLQLSELGLAMGPSFRFDGRFGYQLLAKTGNIPERYPRRTGVPVKRPLF